MKHLVAVCVAVWLSGCVGGGGATGPTELPAGFDLAMWSAKPVGDVQACIAQLGQAGQEFSVREAPRNDGQYLTLVVSQSGIAGGRPPTDVASPVVQCL